MKCITLLQIQKKYKICCRWKLPIQEECSQYINRHVTLCTISNIMTDSFCLLLHRTVTYAHSKYNCLTQPQHLRICCQLLSETQLPQKECAMFMLQSTYASKTMHSECNLIPMLQTYEQLGMCVSNKYILLTSAHKTWITNCVKAHKKFLTCVNPNIIFLLQSANTKQLENKLPSIEVSLTAIA